MLLFVSCFDFVCFFNNQLKRVVTFIASSKMFCVHLTINMSLYALCNRVACRSFSIEFRVDF